MGIKEEITISLQNVDDAEQISYVNKTTWLATYVSEEHGITRDLIEKRFEDSEGRVKKIGDWIKSFGESSQGWKARVRDEVVGYVVALRENNELRIRALYVLPDFQGRGVGTELMKVAMDWLGEGEKHVAAWTYNEKAIKFYEKFGFRVVGKSNDKVDLGNGVFMDEVEMLK